MSDTLLHGQIITTLKAAAWERAKGELRSVAALSGTHFSHRADAEGKFPYQYGEEAIEAFIADFEAESLHE